LPHTAVPSEATQESAVTIERRGHVLLIGLNRPAKRNAFNAAMIEQLAAAYHELEHDEEIRCGVLFGHGDHFTGGLDLAEVGPLVREGRLEELSLLLAVVTRGARTTSGPRRWSRPSTAG
jgi:enoyl-CoA hydratase